MKISKFINKLKDFFGQGPHLESPYSIGSDLLPYYISHHNCYFWQSVDFSKTYLRLSNQAKQLFQYILGAINYYKVVEVFRSYNDITQDLGLSRYGIDKARQELEAQGLIKRITKSYKNKSHWSVNFVQFFKSQLKAVSRKFNIAVQSYIQNSSEICSKLDQYSPENLRSANSYNTRDLSSNNINNTIYAKLTKNCSFDQILDFVYENYKKIVHRWRNPIIEQPEKPPTSTREWKPNPVIRKIDMGYYNRQSENEYFSKPLEPIRIPKKVNSFRYSSPVNAIQVPGDGLTKEQRQGAVLNEWWDKDPYGVLKGAEEVKKAAIEEGMSDKDFALKQLRGFMAKFK